MAGASSCGGMHSGSQFKVSSESLSGWISAPATEPSFIYSEEMQSQRKMTNDTIGHERCLVNAGPTSALEPWSVPGPRSDFLMCTLGIVCATKTC